MNIQTNKGIIDQAVGLLRQGKLVAIPTETVYGLAADATNAEAVASIYALKERPRFNPLITHFAHVQDVEMHGVLGPLARKLAQAFWPGPLTLVLSKRPTSHIASIVSAGLDTLAVRIPAHPVALEILKASGLPLAAPSANPSQHISPTCADHVYAGFGKNPLLSLIVDGGICAQGLESTIIDLRSKTPVLLRPGSLAAQDIEEVLGMPLHIHSDDHGPHAAPGQMKRHYAPRHTTLRLEAEEVGRSEALLAFGPTSLTAEYMLNLSEKGDLIEAAANLFAMLHLLDAQKPKRIAVMPIPNVGLGVAINDRLTRAACVDIS